MTVPIADFDQMYMRKRLDCFWMCILFNLNFILFYRYKYYKACLSHPASHREGDSRCHNRTARSVERSPRKGSYHFPVKFVFLNSNGWRKKIIGKLGWVIATFIPWVQVRAQRYRKDWTRSCFTYFNHMNIHWLKRLALSAINKNMTTINRSSLRHISWQCLGQI